MSRRSLIPALSIIFGNGLISLEGYFIFIRRVFVIQIGDVGSHEAKYALGFNNGCDATFQGCMGYSLGITTERSQLDDALSYGRRYFPFSVSLL